ncbi:N-acetylneuraminate synthase [uncultured Algimonas sp.]|uniref:N-acetylneuraminate synthase n=1 Tax=uncultured Algimonas sp. TaxID=1547920 RepID=UPI00261BA713|nr:N-acetylneuraminate synthase [uncultured Algimonas sp.]
MPSRFIQTFDDPDAPCFVIGEIGVNHNGSLDLAHQLIDIAVEAGADAVKFQTFTAEALVTRTVRKANYQSRNHQIDESQLSMLKRLELSEADLRACKNHCDAKDIVFLSTPFDEAAADLLESVGVQGYKVSSGDLTNLPLLSHMAAKGLPMIISTGMATMAEVEDAVRAVEAAGDPSLAILHCVSDYPAAPEEANLAAIDTISTAFGKPTGWSDHTLGDAVCLAAVARGARIIEKHYTLDTAMEGPDHKASLDPDEFRDLLRKIRIVQTSIGDGVKRPQPSETETAQVARRSIVVARDIKAGETIARTDLVMKRPGTGLAPKHLDWVVGRTARSDLPSDTLVSLDQLG